jgi:hypothetical protein
MEEKTGFSMSSVATQAFYFPRTAYFSLNAFRGEFQREAEQRFEQVSSEFVVLKSVIEKKEHPATAEEHDTILEISRLIAAAQMDASSNYAEMWSTITSIDNLMINLLDAEGLIALAVKLKNNMYLLHEVDRKEWEKHLDVILQANHAPKETEVREIRRVLKTLGGEISEARRVNYMTTELKRSLMFRFMIVTILFGGIVSILTYCLFGDPLVFEAVIFGVLGGFFSRVIAMKDLEFKPPAFPLIALYTYVQPLLGGVGALVLYLVMVSPVSREVFNTETFYLDSTKTQAYIQSLKEHPASIPFVHVDSSSVNRFVSATANYPKPVLLLLLAFLAGFSERWFLGTIETIIGKKLQKGNGAAKSTGEGSGGKPGT